MLWKATALSLLPLSSSPFLHHRLKDYRTETAPFQHSSMCIWGTSQSLNMRAPIRMEDVLVEQSGKGKGKGAGKRI